MQVVNIDTDVSDVAAQVTSRLAAGLELKPKSVTAGPVINGLGDDAWQLTIVLPKPDGATWDVDAVFDVRRACIAAFDALVSATPRELPGQTLAVVTTDEADPVDVAAAETPAEGEDPSAQLDEEPG